MIYSFLCKKCNLDHVESFSASSYDDRVRHDGLLLNVCCENCGASKLYRNIATVPDVLGGTKNYLSLDKYWSQNPDIKRSLEEKHEKKNKNL